MAYISAEFHAEERELCWEVFERLVENLQIRNPKPPKLNATGKIHFYLETPDHKARTKAARQERERNECSPKFREHFGY